MYFEVFGAVDVVSSGGTVTPLAARKPRLVLSCLLLHAGESVSVDRLVAALWGDHPPKSAAGNVKTYVWQLRRFLGADGAGDAGGNAAGDRDRVPSIDNDGNGYRIRVERDRVAHLLFEDRVAAGCRERADGEPRRAAEVLAGALALWRGDPFPDLAGPDVDATRARLTDHRLTGHEHLARALLDLDRPHEAVVALRGLVAEHPFREHLQATMVTALHRAGRAGEALTLFEHVRGTLDRELGVLPGAELRRAHLAILGDDTGGTTEPPRRVAPAQLPTAPRGFVGRDEVVRAMDALVDDPDPAPFVLTGTAGVGKSASALHWAHRVRSRFPDGQLFVGLRAHAAGPPLTARQALEQLLHALAVDQTHRPSGVDAAAAAYRSALADRRVLVVLDDAEDAAQVRPLLPGVPGCAVVVTSRNRLDGLVAREGARQVRLDVLTPEAGLAVLHRMVGADRLAANRPVARELVALCGGLPLALRIAAAHLLARPDRSVGDYVRELRTGDRLAGLQLHGDPETAVRAAIDLSHAARTPAEQRLFRLLGLVPGPDTTPAAVAALADVDVAEAERGLRALVAAHLVEEPAPGRHALHELVRLYALEALEQADEGHAPLERLLGWYVDTADRASDALDPGRFRLPHPDAAWGRRDPVAFDGAATATAWFTAEAANLSAVVRTAADNGPRWAAWYLADALKGFFLRGNTTHWPTVLEAAFPTTTDPLPTAALHNSAGILGLTRGDYTVAADHFTASFEAATAAGWRLGQAGCLTNLGVLHYYTGPLRTALDHLTRADEIVTDAPECAAHAGMIQVNLGATALGLGRPVDATDHLNRALAVQEETGFDRGRGAALLLLAETRLHTGDLAEARELIDRAEARIRTTAIDHELARCHEIHARVALAHGDHHLAHDLLGRAAALAEGDHTTEVDIRNATAVAHRRTGRPHRATALHRQALTDSRRSRYLRGQVDALIGLAATHREQGEPDEAALHAATALDLARAADLRTLEAEALTELAAADLARGDHRAAIANATEAHALDTETGRGRSPARTLLLQAEGAARTRPRAAE